MEQDARHERRHTDGQLAEIRQSVALLEQAQRLGSEAQGARYDALQQSVATIAAKLDATAEKWDAVTAEAVASPAGRQILKAVEELQNVDDEHNDRLDRHSERLDEHDSYFDQLKGSYRTSQVISLGLGIIASLIAIVNFVGKA